MAEITNLKEYNEIKQMNDFNSRISFLEDLLNKVEKRKRDKESTANLDVILNNLFSVEYSIGIEKCKNLSSSKKGFFYIINNYGESDKCMDFFIKKYLKTILYDEKEEDLEEIIHNDFKTYQDFYEARPIPYIVDKIKEEDRALANYICIDRNTNELFKDDIDIIKANWDSFDSMNESRKYNRMLNRLKNYYEIHKMETSFVGSEIIIYLAKKNNILDTLSKYYIFDDDDIFELAKSNEVEEKLKDSKIISIPEQNVINNMEVIMRKTLGLNKGQRLK